LATAADSDKPISHSAKVALEGLKWYL